MSSGKCIECGEETEFEVESWKKHRNGEIVMEM